MKEATCNCRDRENPTSNKQHKHLSVKTKSSNFCLKIQIETTSDGHSYKNTTYEHNLMVKDVSATLHALPTRFSLYFYASSTS